MNSVYAFVDESGDPGFKGGSSKFLTLALVGFHSWDDLGKCGALIQEFKNRNGIQTELHFSHDRADLRKEFLEYVSQCEFFFYGLVINKEKVYFRQKKELYESGCIRLLQTIADSAGQRYTSNASITFDRAGDKKFQESFISKLGSFTGHPNFKPRLEDSRDSNLLQLADYVAGAINKSLPTNKGKQDLSYVRAILDHCQYVKVWPKGDFSSPSLKKYWWNPSTG